MGGSGMIGGGAMRRAMVAASTILVTGCGGLPPPRSIAMHAGPPVIAFGAVADTQLQNREAWAARTVLRNTKVDRGPLKVTIRPPVLDAAARVLLEHHLQAQRERGVAAVFYVGDGSNQGCRSELMGEGVGIEGVLTILRRFRQDSGIPVFLVPGNHDFMAAGNTEDPTEHAALCGGADNAASKLELIRWTDALNRESAELGGWRYASSIGAGLDASCAGASQVEIRQSRRHGCHYAATVDAAAGERRVRFLLVDTNDYVDVGRIRALKRGGNTPLTLDYEGLRGAMSFKGKESQTAWLAARGRESREQGTRPDMLVAVTHYPIRALRRNIIVTVSNKTQRVADVFGDRDGRFYSDAAFVVSAHTHTPTTAIGTTRIVEGREEVARLDEVNVGSTTDFPSLSAVLRLEPSAIGTTLTYEPISPSREGCEAILDDLATTRFPEAFLGVDVGGRAIAFDPRDPMLYHRIDESSAEGVFANIDWWTKDRPDRLVCLGLAAGAVEDGRSALDAAEM